MNGISGRVALVTGASRGIGRACAIRLAREGAAVAVNYRENRAAAEETVAACRALGAESEAFAADVADEVAVDRLVQAVLARWGRIDLLVSNAGISSDGLALSLSAEAFDRVIAVNLRGPFLLARRVGREMVLSKRGRIVNMSSIASRGGRGKSNYVASKAGVEGFTRALALELAPKGVLVNAVAPGMIATDLTEVVRQSLDEKRIPLGRFGRPEDVAGVVAFLCSDDAGYISGETITVDGGVAAGGVV